MASLNDIKRVKRFWEEHPSCAYEIQAPSESPEFFRTHDALKVEHSDRFNIHLRRFFAPYVDIRNPGLLRFLDGFLGTMVFVVAER